MTNNSSCPVFVDGQRMCEAGNVSYTVENDVQYHGSGLPGTPSRIESGPPKFEIELELLSEIRLQIDHNSRVEVAIPPDVHGGTAWRVVEVWEVYMFEQMASGEVTIAAYQGDIHTGVNYLGDDTKVAKEKRGLVEPEDNLSIDISDADEESPETDSDFTANVEDI